jgi:hypothetical protein
MMSIDDDKLNSVERLIIGYAIGDVRAIGDKSAQLVIRHNDCSSTLMMV